MDNGSRSQMNGFSRISFPIQIDRERISDAPVSANNSSVHIPFPQNFRSLDLPVRREVGGRDSFKLEFWHVFVIVSRWLGWGAWMGTEGVVEAAFWTLVSREVAVVLLTSKQDKSQFGKSWDLH